MRLLLFAIGISLFAESRVETGEIMVPSITLRFRKSGMADL